VPIEAVDPVLKDNGGPTFTHALLPFLGSQAIDGTIGQVCAEGGEAPLISTSAGAPRDRGGARCDIGAYEYGAVVP
jgi:hypothetical protein